MADADDAAKTSTVDAPAEDTTKVTDTKDDSKVEAPDLSAGSAAADEGQEDEGAEGGGQGEDEGQDDGSKAVKERNRLGYQVRQLVSSNPNMQALRERLQPWVEDTTDQGEARDRQRDVNDYIRDAARAQDDIQRDNEAVTKELPLFNPTSPEFNESLTKRAYAQYARDMLIEDQNGAVDKNGNPVIVGYRMRLIDYMREKAEDYGFTSNNPKSGKQPSSNTGKQDKKTAKAKMDAAADTPGGSSGASGAGKEEKDPFLAGFDDPYGRHTPQNAHSFSE